MTTSNKVRDKYQAYVEAEREYDRLTTENERAAQNEIIKARHAEYEGAKAEVERERLEFQKRRY